MKPPLRKGRQKTSEARILSARFNPRENSEDEKVLEIIDELIARGYNFKQIASDGILRSAGYEPEMFAKERADRVGQIAEMLDEKMGDMRGNIASAIEEILTDFAEKMMSKLEKMGYRKVAKSEYDDDEDEDKPSKFAKNFTRGYIERQKSINKEEDD